MPSRILFDGKQRPKGLEFGACRQCNQATRREELVVGLVSRVFQNLRPSEERLYLRKLMRSAERNNPGLLEEMRVDQASALKRNIGHMHKLPTWNFLRVDGPIVSGAVEKFIAKLGFALHFETTGNIVPSDGAVGVCWYSNVDSFADRVPTDLLRLVGPGKTLTAGKFTVPEQFRYASVIVEGVAATGHFAVFRESFAAEMFVAEDRADLPSLPENTIYRPGCFQT